MKKGRRSDLHRPFPPPKGPIASADRLQVHCRIFAAAIDLELEFQTVTFVERRDSGALDGRDMHEGIGLAVVALDEAEALHRVEEFDRPARFLAGKLALRPAISAA